MKIPLLADKGLEIARAYGVLKVGGKGNKISSFFGKSDFPRSCLLGICVPFPWEIDANICPTGQTVQAGRIVQIGFQHQKNLLTYHAPFDVFCARASPTSVFS